MGSLIYVAALFVFVSPPFQDAFYSSIDGTVELALFKKTPVYNKASSEHYLGEPKAISWAQPLPDPQRINFSQPDVEEMAKKEPTKAKKSPRDFGADELPASGFEDLGIFDKHEENAKIEIDDILTYFEKSSKSNNDNETSSFDIPNTPSPTSFGESPYEDQPLR